MPLDNLSRGKAIWTGCRLLLWTTGMVWVTAGAVTDAIARWNGTVVEACVGCVAGAFLWFIIWIIGVMVCLGDDFLP